MFSGPSCTRVPTWSTDWRDRLLMSTTRWSRGWRPTTTSSIPISSRKLHFLLNTSNLFSFRNHYRRSVYDGLQPCVDQQCRNGYLCDARQFHQTQKLCTDLEGGVQKPADAQSKKYSARFRKSLEKRHGKAECKIWFSSVISCSGRRNNLIKIFY